MIKYNDNFELSIEDIELIEDALRRKNRGLSNQVIEAEDTCSAQAGQADDLDNTIRQIHDLLGRLHNQKIFYRPQDGAYIGG